jgi:hypothetical protein
VVARRHGIQRFVQSLASRVQRGRPHRQEAAVAQASQEQREHLVNERATLKRIELFDGDRLLPGRQVVDRAQQELVRARGVALQLRRRVGSTPQEVLVKRLARCFRWIGEPIRGRPPGAPAVSTKTKRARKVDIRLE